MPVESQAQGRFLGIHKPEVLRKWKAEGADTKIKGKPYKIGPKPGPLNSMFKTKP